MFQLLGMFHLFGELHLLGMFHLLCMFHLFGVLQLLCMFQLLGVFYLLRMLQLLCVLRLLSLLHLTALTLHPNLSSLSFLLLPGLRYSKLTIAIRVDIRLRSLHPAWGWWHLCLLLSVMMSLLLLLLLLMLRRTSIGMRGWAVRWRLSSLSWTNSRRTLLLWRRWALGRIRSPVARMQLH
ncbi:MAG: hypothetical protein J3R72DRAFT_462970 [Linnemannia gamsii]|nr:MAG: hypothetical protein J3R72DRAFT_462970 [Linnemannia gamsii]